MKQKQNTSLELHKKLQGKIKIENKVSNINREDLSMLYSPGVALPCLEIVKNKEKLYEYTIKQNTIGIITNGTAVLGLGNIGADASLPVMEGKAMLVKEMSGINAFPICIDESDPDKFIDIVSKITTPFGAINLEDIKAPECVYIEQELQKRLDIPVFHDDQHGTAIICLSALINSLKLANKNKENVKIVLSGSGAAGSAICKLLVAYGCKNIYVLNKYGILKPNLKTNTILDEEIANISMGKNIKESALEDVIINSDVFIGVSAPNLLTKSMVLKMNSQPIIFALANPEPEITYKAAMESNAFIYGSGRSDFPNQINNLSVFPGLLKLCLVKKLKIIDTNLKIKIALSIANHVPKKSLSVTNILPDPLDKYVTELISKL